jgi:hypothetical protein
MRVLVMRTFVAGFLVVLAIAVSAGSLHAQQVDITAPPTRPEIQHPESQDKGREGEPSKVTLTPNRTVVPGHSLSGEGAGSVGFGVAAEWGARQDGDRQRVR